MPGFTLICITIYLSGVVVYSALFIASSNQEALAQTAKIFIAGIHCLFLIVPAVMAQSRHIALRSLGFVLIAAYFLYAIFLVGFFPYFGFVPELYAFDFGSLRDLGEVSDHYFRQLFGWREVALVMLFALLVWQIRRIRIPKYGVTVIAAPLLLITTSFLSFGEPADSEKFGNVTVLRRFGPVVFGYASLAEGLSFRGAYLAENTEYPGKVAKLIAQTRAPGKAFVPEVPEVTRVVIVQIESFDAMSIDARLSELPVMPFVSGLRANCLNYKNFFTMKGAGGSSDVEFSIATGLVPSARVPALKHVEFADVETLYEQLWANGIRSTFSHNNQSGFYGRNKAYGQLTSVKAQFMDPLEQVAEVDFAREGLADALVSSDKSLHYFFNFGSHGPYQGYSEATEAKFSIRRGDDIRIDYLATMNEVDDMIRELFELQLSGFEKGKNLFMLMADHPSYLHDTEDELSQHRIPAMICHRDFDGAEISNLFGSIDLYPTILEAFGVFAAKDYLGQSMFWEAPNAVLLPSRKIIHRNSAGNLEITPCNENCDAYFKYTEQYIRF